jgi:hypothetical protein
MTDDDRPRPALLQGALRPRRLLLDYEGAEVVIIGAAADAEAELGIELDAETERIQDADLLRQLR